jgi:hypothetical protein
MAWLWLLATVCLGVGALAAWEREHGRNGNVGTFHVPGTSFRFVEREHAGTSF